MPDPIFTATEVRKIAVADRDTETLNAMVRQSIVAKAKAGGSVLQLTAIKAKELGPLDAYLTDRGFNVVHEIERDRTINVTVSWYDPIVTNIDLQEADRQQAELAAEADAKAKETVARIEKEAKVGSAPKASK